MLTNFHSTTIVSILRLRTLITSTANANSSWNYTDLIVWSEVEVFVGVVCACLPTLRLLLVRVFPFFGGSSRRITGSYEGRRATKGTSAPSNTRGHTTNITTINRGEDGVELEEGLGNGIAYDKTYTVQYSDNDEASLVPLRDLNKPTKETTTPKP